MKFPLPIFLLRPLRSKGGFTLVELLVVIVIISILAGVISSTASAVQELGRNTQRKSDLRKVQAALEQYHADLGFYPCSTGEAVNGLCPLPAQARNGFNNHPTITGAHLTNCTGNPDPGCTEKLEYFFWSFEDPIFKDGMGSGAHYCYTAFNNASQKLSCNNTTIKCNYYELAAGLEVAPYNRGVTWETYHGGNWSCNGGSHRENYAISPLGEVPLPSPPGVINFAP